MSNTGRPTFSLAIGFMLLFIQVSQSLLLGSGNSKTLDRDADPVILTGADLPDFLNVSLTELFVYAYANGQWQQIPWQFDEVVDGLYMASDNQLLDETDELVFMGKDCGDRAATTDWLDDTISKANPRYEIAVTDPLDTSKNGWVYLYRSTSLTEDDTEDYVDYDYDTSVFTTPVYILGFHLEYLTGIRLELNGSGIDVLDRAKWRFAAVPVNNTGNEGVASVWNEESMQSDEPQPEIIDGKIRAIAGHQGTFENMVQGLLTIAYRSQFFDLLLFDLSWSPVGLDWIVATADFNENIIGGTYYDANTPSGVTVDGNPDDVVTSPATQWQQISADTGTVFHAVEASRMEGTQSTYYMDNSNVDPDDSGDQKSFGDMGIKISNPVKMIAGSLTHYILPPNEPNVGERYYNYFINPLQAQANIQNNVSGPVFYSGYQADENGDVDTGNWLGWINVQSDPYIWLYSFSTWAYAESVPMESLGAWMYLYK